MIVLGEETGEKRGRQGEKEGTAIKALTHIRVVLNALCACTDTGPNTSKLQSLCGREEGVMKRRRREV